MKHIRLIIFLALASLAACSSGDDPRLAVADSLLEQRPDSAMAILRSVDSHKLDKGNRAYYALLFTAAQYKCYEPIVSDSLIDIAVDYYAGSSDHNRRLRSLIFKGAALEEMGDQLAAIDWYKKAESEASPTDFESIGYINLRLGGLYLKSYIQNYEDIEKYKKALRCYQIVGNDRLQQVCLNNLAARYRLVDMDSAYKYVDMAIALAKQNNDTVEFFQNKEVLARAYYFDSLYSQSKVLAKHIIEEGEGFIDMDMPLFDIIHAYIKLGKPDSAQIYMSRLQDFKLNGQQLVSKLRAEVSVAAATNDYKKAFLLSDSIRNLTDSILDNSRQKELFFLEKRYDKTMLELENMEITRHNLIAMIVSFLSVMIIIIAACLLYFKKRRQLREAYRIRDQIQNEHNDSLKLIYQHKSANQGLKLSMKNQLNIMKEIIECSYLYGNKTTKFMDKFREIVKINKKNDDDFWKNLEHYANLCFNNIISSFRTEYPNLKEHELQFICLMICGFSPIEIMVCMGYTNEHSISNKRLTISKKIGTSLSLEEFLNRKINDMMHN